MAEGNGCKSGGRDPDDRRARQSAEAIAGRVREQLGQRELARQAGRLGRELVAQEQAEAEVQAPGGPRQRRRAQARHRGKLADRELRLLERNDELVRQVLERERRLSGIMSAEGATQVDELLWFLADELGLLPVFEALTPPPTGVQAKTGKKVARRTGYPPLVLNLLGLISRYLGVVSNPEIEASILVDQHWMGLLGFSAVEVESGACRRGESLRGKTRQGRGGRFVEADSAGPVRTRLEGWRGALSSQTLQGHESALEPWQVVEAFNAVVRVLAARGYYPKEVHGSLDSTGEEVVPTFAGAGKVRKKVEVHSKARRPRRVEVTVRGFKVWYLMDVDTGLPLAMTLDTINTPDTEHVRSLVDQARANLGKHGRLASVALDRGFLDGDLLWWLKDQRGIVWYCPAKEKMAVTGEARERVRAVLAASRSGQEGPLVTARRLARGGRTYEGVSFAEQGRGPHRDTLVVAQVDDLRCTEFYGPDGSASSRTNSKDYRPTPRHATVVLRPQDQVRRWRTATGRTAVPRTGRTWRSTTRSRRSRWYCCRRRSRRPWSGLRGTTSGR